MSVNFYLFCPEHKKAVDFYSLDAFRYQGLWPAYVSRIRQFVQQHCCCKERIIIIDEYELEERKAK